MLRTLGMLSVALLLFVAAGCHPAEGERCNPLLFNDECTAGNASLQCTYPTGCGVAYCCPIHGTSSNPNCQACPGDGGVDASVDASTTD
jgi:hypothetical protein